MTPERAKTVSDFLVHTMEAEVPVTAGVFAAVPGDRLDYTPHPKSKTALQLLRHLTLEDEWFLKSVADGSFGPMPDESDACGIMTPDDAVREYKRRIPAVLQQISALPGDALAKEMDFFGFMQMPAAGFVSLTLRHSIHHRGQLSAYLRAMGAKVPGIYGPSADTVVAV